jgi:hypothetical protein
MPKDTATLAFIATLKHTAPEVESIAEYQEVFDDIQQFIVTLPVVTDHPPRIYIHAYGVLMDYTSTLSFFGRGDNDKPEATCSFDFNSWSTLHIIKTSPVKNFEPLKRPTKTTIHNPYFLE